MFVELYQRRFYGTPEAVLKEKYIKIRIGTVRVYMNFKKFIYIIRSSTYN